MIILAYLSIGAIISLFFKMDVVVMDNEDELCRISDIEFISFVFFVFTLVAWPIVLIKHFM